MSLVSTYVQAVDGKFYRNPVLKDDNWFICFDDDDPPELVMTKEFHRDISPNKLLSRLGIKYKQLSWGGTGNRIFGEKWKFKPAKSFFFYLTAPIPIPNEHDGIYDRPKGDCCFFEFKNFKPIQSSEVKEEPKPKMAPGKWINKQPKMLKHHDSEWIIQDGKYIAKVYGGTNDFTREDALHHAEKIVFSVNNFDSLFDAGFDLLVDLKRGVLTTAAVDRFSNLLVEMQSEKSKFKTL